MFTNFDNFTRIELFEGRTGETGGALSMLEVVGTGYLKPEHDIETSSMCQSDYRWQAF
jgi:hypothetical protein